MRPESIDRRVQADSDVVFFLDVDNTLLDNDRIIADLRTHLEQEFGFASSDCYWTIFEDLRDKLGYADYLGALQLYRAFINQNRNQEGELGSLNGEHPAQRLLFMSSFLVDYPFAERLYPDALDVVARLSKLGPTVILSDGDVVFQPRKIQRSGLWQAVHGRVLIYIHKEQMLDEVQRLYPARRYVMVDDKQRVLTAMKHAMGDRLVTIFPRQGHYAEDPANVARYPRADCTVERIGDLLDLDFDALLGTALQEQS